MNISTQQLTPAAMVDNHTEKVDVCLLNWGCKVLFLRTIETTIAVRYIE